jgi:Family of unknown function (DUF6011)
MSSHQLRDPEIVLKFVLAGNARFTLVSRKSGTRYTYRVRQPESTTPHFVQLMNGPDNEANYEFVGSIMGKETYRHGHKSRVKSDAPSVVAFMWFWSMLRCGQVSEQLEFWHEGRCCRCGRALTVPESIEAGVGPECAGYVL